MCGRYSLAPGEFSEIQIQFQVDTAVDFEPRYNIAPTWSPGHEPPIVLLKSSGQCELADFGLVPELTGQGNGGWMMRQALALAWRKGIDRVWVHTCTLDHPSALGFYRRHGFVPYQRTIETFADPRLIGLLPADAAPQIPCLSVSAR